ncbi:MAG: hypothetical protein ACKO22_04295 [Cyanobium sp.]
MALPGISNANEFSSAHDLESVLMTDIKKVRERWAQEARAQVEADPLADVATAEVLFKALRKPWQKLREAELGITADPAERLRLQRELFFQPLRRRQERTLGLPWRGEGASAAAPAPGQPARLESVAVQRRRV